MGQRRKEVVEGRGPPEVLDPVSRRGVRVGRTEVELLQGTVVSSGEVCTTRSQDPVEPEATVRRSRYVWAPYQDQYEYGSYRKSGV